MRTDSAGARSLLLDGLGSTVALTDSTGAVQTQYTYDSLGNRTSAGGSLARTSLPQPLSSALYDAANRLTRWGTTSLSYDANGSLLNDGVKTYTWDARNRLSAMTGASFQYDALGRRLSRTVGGSTTGYLYDMVNPVQELSGSTPTANLLTGLGVDEVFTRTDSAGARSLLLHGLGSTLALTDSTGTIQTQYTYEPFGNTTVSGPASTNPLQYTGRENDGTGLYYYRGQILFARYWALHLRGPH